MRQKTNDPNIFLIDEMEHYRDLKGCHLQCRKFICPKCGGHIHQETVYGPSFWYACDTCDLGQTGTHGLIRAD